MSSQTFEVPKRKVAEAFYDWQKRTGRNDGGSPAAFRQRIHARYRLRAPKEELPTITNSRKTWWDWSKLPLDKTVEYDLITLQAIFDLTGKALIDRHLLDKRRNLTTAVEIAQPPTARLVSNAPDAQERETYAISAPEIRFRKSDAHTVTKDWLGATGQAGEIVIGSVVFGLRNAAIKVSASGDVDPQTRLLKPNRGNGAEGVSLSYDGEGCWNVGTEEGEVHLLGSLSLPEFAQVSDRPEGAIELTVEVQPSAIDPIFSAITDDLAKDVRKDRARNHLLQKVLKLALAERGDSLVFAVANAEKACLTNP